MPMEPRRNASAMAVTGGPRSFPMVVVLPRVWERVAVALSVAMFAQLFWGEIRGSVSEGRLAMDSEVDVDVDV